MPMFIQNFLSNRVLTIYKLQIPFASQTLGVIFDNKLNFKAYIDHVRQKCEKNMKLLKVVSKMDEGADRSVLLRLLSIICSFYNGI